MVKINPVKIFDTWDDGYALDIHTVGSEFLGYDEFGHERFKNERSPLGELVYRLKYNSDQEVLGEIVETATNFIQTQWKIQFQVILPIPPSKIDRPYRPVNLIAEQIGKVLKIPVVNDAFKRIKDTGELKNIDEFEKRIQILDGAFKIDPTWTQGKKVLLVDDLYRSGATFNNITKLLLKYGKTK